MKGLGLRWLAMRLRILTAWRIAVESAHYSAKLIGLAPESQPDDVFVCSYPKSGTTLMQMILFQLATDGDIERIPHIDSFCPWFEVNVLLGPGDLLASWPAPRFFKSHLLRSGLPRRGKFIYLLRDVRDVAVSAYHHRELMAGHEIDFEPFVEELIRGDSIFYGSWFRNLGGWWRHRHDADVLVVPYDEMIADLAATVRRVAAFCGMPPPGAEMPRILAHCAIPYMKAHDGKLDPRLHLTTAAERSFFGQGKPGAGRAELSAAQRRLLTHRVARLARELGEPGAAHPPRLLVPNAD